MRWFQKANRQPPDSLFKRFPSLAVGSKIEQSQNGGGQPGTRNKRLNLRNILAVTHVMFLGAD